MHDNLRDSALQTLGYFKTYFIYPLPLLERVYINEILNYSDKEWEAPQRAARLGAAVKNYKTSQMILFVFQIAVENELDLTPLVVKRLCKSLFGRTGSQKLIVDVFGEKGRVHRSEHSNPETIDAMTRKYQSAAQAYWISTLVNIERVKRKYRESGLR